MDSVLGALLLMCVLSLPIIFILFIIFWDDIFTLVVLVIIGIILIFVKDEEVEERLTETLDKIKKELDN